MFFTSIYNKKKITLFLYYIRIGLKFPEVADIHYKDDFAR